MPALVNPPIHYSTLKAILAQPPAHLSGFERGHRRNMEDALSAFKNHVLSDISNEHSWRELAVVRYQPAGARRNDPPTFQRAVLNLVKSLGYGPQRDRNPMFEVTTIEEVKRQVESFQRLMGQARAALAQLSHEDYARKVEEVAQAEQAEQLSEVGFTPISHPSEATLDGYFPQASSFRRANTMHSLPSSSHHQLSLAAQRHYGISQGEFAARWA